MKTAKRHTRTLLNVGLVLCVCLIPFAAGSQAEEGMASQSQSPAGSAEMEPSGDPPQKSNVQYHLEQARLSYSPENTENSVNHLMEGIKYLRIDAGRAPAENAKKMHTAIEGLVNLTDRVQNEKFVSPEEFKGAFTPTFSALSQHHFEQAVLLFLNPGTESTSAESWSLELSGDLNESMRNFRAWASESGTELKESTQQAMKNIETLAEQLIVKADGVSEQFGAAIDTLAENLRTYGTDLKFDTRDEKMEAMKKDAARTEADELRI